MLYFGYKFTDRIFFNSELEFEHASTEENVRGSEGEVGMEFALLDFILIPEFNLRAGLLIALFVIINEVHEPTTFYGVFCARTELFLITTMWRENGLGIFGEVDLSRSGMLSFKAHFMNSFDAKGFRATSNRGISFYGSEALFNNVVLVSRDEY